MRSYTIYLNLLSDTTFGRGDGIASVIDQEVEQDIHGFPFLRGRTLKGLLREECDNLVDVLPQAKQPSWRELLALLFGVPGSDISSMGQMQVGDAQLPADLRQAVARQIQENKLTAADVLNSLTTLRCQTAIDAETGVASDNSLRTNRVVLRGLVFQATLDLEVPAHKLDDSLALLSAGIKALRRVGSGRNCGRGHIKCWLQDETTTNQYCDHFCNKIQEVATV